MNVASCQNKNEYDGLLSTLSAWGPWNGVGRASIPVWLGHCRSGPGQSGTLWPQSHHGGITGSRGWANQVARPDGAGRARTGRNTSSCSGLCRVAAWQARADPGGISHSPAALRTGSATTWAGVRSTGRLRDLATTQGNGAVHVRDVVTMEAIKRLRILGPAPSSGQRHFVSLLCLKNKVAPDWGRHMADVGFLRGAAVPSPGQAR